MATDRGNPLEMGIEFQKPSKEMVEILKLRERLNLAMVALCSMSGISIGCTIYVVQVLTGAGPIV
ncbi:hypothetical protein ACFOEK_12145 [Litoribrevibacter euphylliae]|uniref:Uncharacterized protein n=1 Tax=Litoribrevibacter euphylliae TaxID=1834034 RepID=A0ABV7HJT5_9GAMM